MPKYFLDAFATDGDKTAIPDATQVDGSVSYADGFGEDYELKLFTNPDAKAIPRRKSNQLYFDITSNLKHWQEFCVPAFITTIDHGGTPFAYSKFALVRYDDGVHGERIYQSLVDDNETEPTDEDSWAFVDFLTSQPFNGVINGSMQVAQRQDATFSVVGDEYYGKVDMMSGVIGGTAVTNGSLTQATGLSFGSSGTALWFKDMTITGTGIVYALNKTSSQDSQVFKNRKASISAIVKHDVGSSKNYKINVYKADAANNFAAVTLISSSASIPVANNTETLIKFEDISMGDCSNGIQIEVLSECGAVTTKNFYVNDLQINLGSFAIPFVKESFENAMLGCLTRYRKSYEYGVSVGVVTNVGEIIGVSSGTNSGTFHSAIIYNIPMLKRPSFPTVKIYSPATGTLGKLSLVGTGDVDGAVDGPSNSTKGFNVLNTGTITDATEISFHYEVINDL